MKEIVNLICQKLAPSISTLKEASKEKDVPYRFFKIALKELKKAEGLLPYLCEGNNADRIISEVSEKLKPAKMVIKRLLQEEYISQAFINLALEELNNAVNLCYWLLDNKKDMTSIN